MSRLIIPPLSDGGRERLFDGATGEQAGWFERGVSRQVRVPVAGLLGSVTYEHEHGHDEARPWLCIGP